MNPADRKLKVLKAIVDIYTATGEPVGSKAVCAQMEEQVSSATVRNDMAELSERGLIIQPHTSAGRVPSQQGYRLYVDRLLDKSPVSDQQAQLISERLLVSGSEPENILSQAVNILHEMTGCIAAVTTPVDDDARVYSVNFVRIGRHTAMLVLTTSSGMVKTRLFRCEYVITEEIITIFKRLMNDRITGMLLKDINRSFIQTTAASLGELGILLSEVLWSLMQTARESCETGLLKKWSIDKLMGGDYEVQEIASLLSFAENNQALADMISSCEASVLIGDEIGVKELSCSAVISSEYRACGDAGGVLALICPMRVNYSEALELVGCTAAALSDIFADLIDIN